MALPDDNEPRCPVTIPEPDLLAHLPVHRGLRVPIVTPYRDGQPKFGSLHASRILVLAQQRRCGVCGLVMADDEPRWHPYDAAESIDIAEAVALGGVDTRITVGSGREPELPGHLACILYAAVACPYLSDTGLGSSGASSRMSRTCPAGIRRRGVARYDNPTWEMTDQGVGVLLGPVRELITYHDGAELLERLEHACSETPAPDPDDVAFVRRLQAMDIDSDEFNQLLGASLKAAAREGGHGLMTDTSVPARHPHGRKVGRNEPCPCGSGTKSKRCCHR